METVLFTLMIVFIIYSFMTSDGAIPMQYAPPVPQLGIDPDVQITEMARKLGVRASYFEANVWSFQYESEGLTSRVSAHLEPGVSDDVRTWFVSRLVLHNDASLPGGVAIGTRGPRSDEEPVDLPLPGGFQSAYWLDGRRAEILATCDTTLCEALLDAHRAAPRWSHVMLGQSTVFERITGTDSKLGELEGILLELLEGAHACVRALPRTQDLAALLRRRVESDDEPLTMRWRAAHALMTQMPRTMSAQKLVASLDDLPDALHHVCSVWSSDREGDPRDAEPALVGVLTGELVDDGAPLYLALSEAGWDASGSARVELMRRGSAALGEALRGEGYLSDGQLTLADEPAARGGLSRAAHAGELSPADEEV